MSSSQLKGKSYKRKRLQESLQGVQDEENQILSNDDSDDEIDVDAENYSKFSLCEELRRNNEVSYHRTNCELWSHAMCSG